MCLKFKIIVFLLCLTVGIQSYFMIRVFGELREAEKLNEILAEEVEVLEGEADLSDYINTEFLGDHVLTFYTHTGNRTASGVYPKAGRTVAVDTKYIPHGTVLYIEGIGLRVAEDTGGDIKGKRLDVFVDTKEEAIKKGVKKAKVHVIKGKK